MQKITQLATAEQITHITIGLSKYVVHCKALAVAGPKLDQMYMDDADYNNTCLQEFLKHKSIKKLVRAIIYQDTAPREKALASFVVAPGSKELGFTWDSINSVA